MTTQSLAVDVVQICIPNSKRDYYDYLASDLNPCIGTRVRVPFQHRERIGVVVGTGKASVAVAKLKSISACIDEQPLLSADNLELARWVARYYQAPLSEVLALVLPKQLREGKALQLPQQAVYHLARPLEDIKPLIRASATRQWQVIEGLQNATQGLSASHLSTLASKKILNTLVEKGVLSVEMQVALPKGSAASLGEPLQLNEEQAAAVTSLSADLSSFQCSLLEGVTGSGKTEVYLQVIAKVLQQQRQVLILVPEIGLTPQLIARFQNRFSEPMAVMHSHLNNTERFHAWQLARAGTLRIIIGTRTAVFIPMPDLGLIVIDEEHDTSLKQMDGVRYSARDTALMRARNGNIPIILGSATPSLESLHNAHTAKYQHLLLRQKAMTDQALHYQLVDMRNTSLREGLAAVTLQHMRKHLDAGNQVLVFINRRGFAPVVLCHQCGTMVDCKDCDSHMTLHRPQNRLRCHHCGRSQRMPQCCAHCQATELIAIGTGTQRLQQYFEQVFPEVKLLRIDRDEVSRKDAFEAHLERIHRGEVQLIIGTQMLAKGHHFPNVTLAVILDADAGLSHADFRATERLGQLLLQVAGRAGRAEKAGEVLIQTHQPQHPLLNELIRYGYSRFATLLLASREQALLPPWHYLALIRARDRNPQRVHDLMQAIRGHLRPSNVSVLGPAPAPLARKAGEHQLQILIKSATRAELQKTLTQMRHWLTMNPLAKSVHWSVDVDPQELA